jgi:SRSO17 transposase
MTDEQVREVGPAFSAWLRRFRPCFLQDRTARHFDDYCRGLLSGLPRKTVEPVALASGTAVRTLQEFLVTANWDHARALATLQRHLASLLPGIPGGALGTVGVIDETSCVKKGTKTPGVQRQHPGCVGKVDNGVVTVHVGVSRGRLSALLDADLFLPESWDADRERCREAGVPDGVRYRPKWRIAFDQLMRLAGSGVHFDWLTFDEGYGSKVPFLMLLDAAGKRFVAEVPVSFSVRVGGGPEARRADEALGPDAARRGRRWRQGRESVADAWWRWARLPVRVRDRVWTLVAAINEATGQVKYFVSNAGEEGPARLLQVAFRRGTVEHGFRLAKQEGGLTHYEGRQYTGLMRHLILVLVVMGFVAIHADGLRGGKSGGDSGAGVPGAEREVRGAAAEAARDGGGGARRGSDPLPPATQRHGQGLAQAAAA